MLTKTPAAPSGAAAALPESGSPPYLFLIAAVAALGGLLFGYDTAVISGAVSFLTARFHLGPALTGWAASCALLGCIVGAAVGGPLSDRAGRKPVLALCALLFGVSGVTTALAATLGEFVWARILGGVAIGAVSVISPLYIAEIAPEKVRGRLVALYQLAIVSGILIVFFVNLLIQRHGTLAWDVAVGWRWMFGSLTLPAAVFAALTVLIPESPRWLMKMGREAEAQVTLGRVGGRAEAAKEMQQIRQSLADEGGHIGELFVSGYRRALLAGVMLAIIAQFSGINAIMYYAPKIFAAMGSGRDGAFAQTIAVGAVNLLFTLVAIRLIDRAGRRPLLIIGSVVQVVSLFAVGVALDRGLGGIALLIPILAFVAAFAAGMGPVPWVVISEIFPTRVRGLAMSLAVLALWGADYVVSQSFPVLLQGIGAAKTFWIYAACSLLGLFFVFRVIPETNGRTLEQIERSWKS